MLKQGISVILGVLLLSQTVISVFAQNGSSEQDQLPPIDLTNTVSEIDYWQFQQQNPGQNYLGKDIKIQASDYVSAIGSEVEKIDYKGKSQAVLWKNESGKLEWKVTVPETGYYRLGLEYFPLIEKENDIEIAVWVNGAIPFTQASSIILPRIWKNDGEVRKDVLGNEISPVQVQEGMWTTEWVKDTDGLSVEPLTFLLNKGENTISIEMVSGAVGLNQLLLGASKKTDTYAQISKQYQNYENYTGAPVFIEGESALYKTSKALRPMSDQSDPSVTPSDVYKQKINYIGAYNWKQAGEKLIWEVDVPEDGLYQINFKYRQSYLRNGSSIRKLKIDDKSFFAEMEEIKFYYGLRWQIQVLGDDQPQLVYLTKGPHKLSMEVSLGEIADVSRRLEKLVFEIGETYRKMVMITGSEPDANRDYRLFDQIPGLLDDLQSYQNQLCELADEIELLSESKGGSDAVVLRNLADVMNRMLRSKFRMHEYIKDYFTNYSSVSAWLYEMRNMPLDIDSIILSAPGQNLKEFTSNFWEKTVYSVQKFFLSFVTDYNTISLHDGKHESITLWLNWGRDQAQVLDAMVKDLFTPQSNVTVNIKLVNATLIQAILSGNAPDCSLMLSRGQPVNLAMRDALYDLSGFSDFKEVTKRFADGATVPYEYQGGIYGLPDTQQFYMMFCRDDVLERLNLKAPTTWDELIRCASVIMRYNMQIGIPYTQVTDMYQTETGIGSMNLFPALLYQYGSELYTEDKSATQLMSSEAVQAFDFWTSLYSKYKFPLEYDFYNRFRTGEMPIAIANYTEYARLMAAAPEIRGRWSIHQVPGVIKNGKLNNMVAGGGTASVILKESKHPQAAWEFIKWWTGEEAQYRYGSEIESLLGISARHPTSNLNAFAKQNWKKQDYEQLMKQWANVKEVPEVPGGYFTQRALNNAFWSTVKEYENPRDMLLKWGKTIDEEIARKREEYDIE